MHISKMFVNPDDPLIEYKPINHSKVQIEKVLNLAPTQTMNLGYVFCWSNTPFPREIWQKAAGKSRSYFTEEMESYMRWLLKGENAEPEPDKIYHTLIDFRNYDGVEHLRW